MEHHNELENQLQVGELLKREHSLALKLLHEKVILPEALLDKEESHFCLLLMRKQIQNKKVRDSLELIYNRLILEQVNCFPLNNIDIHC